MMCVAEGLAGELASATIDAEREPWVCGGKSLSDVYGDSIVGLLHVEVHTFVEGWRQWEGVEGAVDGGLQPVALSGLGGYEEGAATAVGGGY